MFFGDDDGVLPEQIPILKSILEKEKPDVSKMANHKIWMARKR